MTKITNAQTMKALPRRRFLTLCALTALPGMVSACLGPPEGSGQATRAPRLVGTPTPVSTPAEADWSQLAASLEGSLLRPGNSQYGIASELFNPLFDDIRPQAVAFCASAADVQRSLAFARRFALPLAPRAGGHSYGGYSMSTGIVIDVTRMNALTVNAASGIATVGAGARLVDVYSELAEEGLALPAGSCPTVGVAGLALGGGVGVLGRKFGLTCDSLVAAQVVLADGRLLTCDANHEPDLFWALRGGGGGNFGVVTELTFNVYPVATLSLFTLDWPWASAIDMVDGWQRWAPQAPSELWSNCLLLTTSDKSDLPLARVNGVYVGGVAALETLLGQLSSQIGSGPTSSYVSGSGLLETMLIEANCGGLTVNECHLPGQTPQGQLTRDIFAAKSDYFTSMLPRAAIANLVSAVASRQSSSLLGPGLIDLDASGGAINRVAPSATAFVHRTALFSAQYFANWYGSDAPDVVAANRAWLLDTWQSMRPYANGEAYQNYLDPDLDGWQNAYYGANLPRLRQVKAAYDPSNLFHFAQSIPPAN